MSRPKFVLPSFLRFAYPSAYVGRARTPHTRHPEDLADALAFALRFSGRKRKHDAEEIIAGIVARRLVDHLERSGFVVMKRAPIGGGAALGRGFEGR